MKTELDLIKIINGHGWGAIKEGYKKIMGKGWDGNYPYGVPFWKRQLYMSLMSQKMGGAKPIISSFEFINHCICMGNEVYNGTMEEDKCTMQHDNLYLWTKYHGAAAYLRAMVFDHHQLRSYRANFSHAHWVSKIAGYSPGLNRLTDTYGFSHLTRAIQFNESLSKPFWKEAHLKNKVFDMGMEFSMVLFMDRDWSNIFQRHFTNNTMGYKRYLVVANKAYTAYFPVSEAHSRQRQEAMVKLKQEPQGLEDTVKYLKTKPRKRQRKETLTIMAHHSDLDGMVEAIQAEEKDMEAAHATAE